MNLARLCRYLPAPPASFPWMRETFHDHVLRMPGCPRDVLDQAHALIRAVHVHAASAVVASLVGQPDAWLGWAAVLDGRILFAYVRAEFRCNGIGLELAGSLTERVPLEVAYWTDDVQGMADHGIPVRYSLEAYRSLLAFVRGPAARRAA